MQAQSLHGLSPNDVRFDNLIDIRFGHVSVPHRIRIYHDIRTVLALVEASRLISAYASLEPAGGKLLLEEFL